jgi:hypothetical protein
MLLFVHMTHVVAIKTAFTVITVYKITTARY